MNILVLVLGSGLGGGALSWEKDKDDLEKLGDDSLVEDGCTVTEDESLVVVFTVVKEELYFWRGSFLLISEFLNLGE